MVYTMVMLKSKFRWKVGDWMDIPAGRTRPPIPAIITSVEPVPEKHADKHDGEAVIIHLDDSPRPKYCSPFTTDCDWSSK